MKAYPRVLTIAGSDSGGGAGIQADLKTFSALGCYGMSVITALTAQNTLGVTAIHAAPVGFVIEQMDAVLGDIGVDAVKIGMLHSAEIIHAVAERLRRYRISPIVVDPVMVSKSGDALLQEEGTAALKRQLLPLATVLTPNLPEASVLLGRAIQGTAACRQACVDLGRLGPKAVLLKGGHLSSPRSPDLLCTPEEVDLLELDAKRIETPNTHGTGCTLSAAVAAFLARGYSIREAVKAAKEYITQALQAGADYTLGHGHGPVHHFFNWW
ncbi:MAG: bifunctional hydroxymethylpyrimidine kinase/phosphomethylpyrimidine kinase [Chloroflexota bacterium]